jgi:hypothetical protein
VRYNTNVGTKAFTLASADKAHEALEPANRSLELAEKIYPKNDPRLHKSLRVLATVKSKQDKFDEAEKLYLRYFYLQSATYCGINSVIQLPIPSIHPISTYQPIHSMQCNAMYIQVLHPAVHRTGSGSSVPGGPGHSGRSVQHADPPET